MVIWLCIHSYGYMVLKIMRVIYYIHVYIHVYIYIYVYIYMGRFLRTGPHMYVLLSGSHFVSSIRNWDLPQVSNYPM